MRKAKASQIIIEILGFRLLLRGILLSKQGRNISHKINYVLSILIIGLAFFVALPVNKIMASSISEPLPCFMALDGEIDKYTDRDLETHFNALKRVNGDQCLTVTLLLNSPGGDVEAAMRAGTFIRQKELFTYVGNGSCASACVLLFIGGVERTNNGDIGLHRPYSNKYSSSKRDSQVSYELINRKITKYLKQMNIPEGLLNTMNSIPPDTIKWLAKKDVKELQELHITGEDPVYADERDSALAKKYGIDKKEYYYRHNRVDDVCVLDEVGGFYSAMVSWGKCREDVMNGRR